MANTQEWLMKNYPKDQRKNITELNISYRYLEIESKLDLSEFVNLEKLNCNTWQFNNLIDGGLEYLPKTLEKICLGEFGVCCWEDSNPELEEIEDKRKKLWASLENYYACQEEDLNCGEIGATIYYPYYDMKRWRENHPYLIINAQKVIELESILNNLNLVLTTSHVKNETINQGLQVFIFETQSRINELKKEIEKAKKENLETKIEILPNK